ncbi:DUF397 domain-containing protein [Streptomyces sp. S12]|uniref:DUF397 domain-containing protein n=1 Tax=unclassified Streptomyces TaxID=2593676 RepID=UPI0019618888|nr:DUF397 domain-containing protein [Streptomyces sp. S12]
MDRPRNWRHLVTRSDVWRKSSYSGSGDGNACVEIAEAAGRRIAIRDSKYPTRAPLSVPAFAFAAFVGGLKERRPSQPRSRTAPRTGAPPSP